MFMGRREHHARRLRAGQQALGQLQAVQARHLDVEEDNLGRQLVDQAQRLDAVGGTAGDLQFGPGERQLPGQVVEQVRFVVGDQGTEGDGITSVKGSSRRAVTPPC